MRTVAVAIALAALLAVPMSAAAPPNDCVNDGTRQVCVPIDLTNAHQGTPGLNGLPYFDIFYVWVGPGHCTNPGADVCNGQGSGSDGVPLPTGGTAPILGVHSVLYQETNGAPGLQRLKVPSGGHLYLADRTVLA